MSWHLYELIHYLVYLPAFLDAVQVQAHHVLAVWVRATDLKHVSVVDGNERRSQPASVLHIRQTFPSANIVYSSHPPALLFAGNLRVELHVGGY